VNPEHAPSIGAVQVLRGATYFLALVVASTAALLAYVSSVFILAVFGVIIAVVLVLLVHQPIGLMTASSVILVALAFIVPATVVRTTYGPCSGNLPTPCDPAPNSHTELRLGIAAVLLFATLIAAAVGAISASRLTNSPHRRRHELV
jgi:hypothetical protein